MKIKQNYYLLLLLVFLMACQNQSESEVAVHSPSGEKEIEIKSYAWHELKPLFEKENDTTYILNFWATWCKPCVEELPYFEELHRQSKGLKQKVVLISLDFPKHVEKKLIPFIEDNKIESHVVLLDEADANVFIDAVDPSWDGAIPISIIYNGAKKTRRFVSGSVASVDELNQIINQIN